MATKEVHFIKRITKNLFSIARTAEEAFHIWSRRSELDVEVYIDGKNLGSDWNARVAIETLFETSYALNQN